ncbi:MAG TPA: type II secretion system secretin GspD [Deltaproteobacteria bacterium]|nr:type II secretion system secretin GspD [Deltaproteobacteria bacterium]
MERRNRNIFQLAMLCVTLFLFVFMEPVAMAQSNTAGSDSQPDRFITIDFNNVDIIVFIKFISELTGTNFVIDQRVKGKVTIISPSKISLKEAYKVFESVLEVHGYTTVKAGELIKIIPSPDARTKSIETLLKEETGSPEDKVVTQLIPLQYADPTQIKRLFTPMISKSSVILDYPPTNMLIVTDVYSNIQRLMRILKTIDIEGIGLELSVIPLEYAEAAKLVKLLDQVFKARNKPKKGETDSDIRFVADERTNIIVTFGSEDDTDRAKRLISLLDKETPRGKEKIRVYYLENAIAEELAKVLQGLPTKAAGEAKGKKAPVVSEEVRITADKATNSLIIMAGKEDYQVLEDIIKQLDIPRAMVYIESLIMEVKVNKGFSLGVQWRALGEISYNDQTGAFGGAFSGGSDAIDEKTVAEPGSGAFALGVISGAIDIVTSQGTITVPNITAIAQALESNRDVHILSTPQILTTDNEEASIVVGRNVPFRTRSTQIEGTAQTFSSFEYKDVGLTLKITPHISKDRMVRLNISHELTALTEAAEVTDFLPTTLKRTINTTVIVEDNNTIVIGGLIDDTFTIRETGVPCLSNVPWLKWLFKTQSKSNEKTNLFVFLTPHVVKNHMEAEAIYKKKKENIDTVKEGRIKLYDKTFRSFDIEQEKKTD